MKKVYRGKDDRKTHPKEIWEFYEETIEWAMFSTNDKIAMFKLCLIHTALEWHKAHHPQIKT